MKQGIGDERRAEVAQEAHVLTALRVADGPLTTYLPRPVDYDEMRALLVTEMVGEGESLEKLHRRTGAIPVDLAADAGKALAALHGIPWRGADAALPPWVLSAHRPGISDLAASSEAVLDVLRIIQATDLPDLLDATREDWSPSAILHGDVRWDNFVVRLAGDEGSAVAVVDWERAGPGDPCWDLGCVLAQPLSAWLNSIPTTGADPPERFPELARHPIESMWPLLRGFWAAYGDASGLDSGALAGCLARATRFAGAWLVQSAIEMSQDIAEVASPVILHLQLALNVIARPTEAAEELLGLSARTTS
jgi:aminoglycoside phosphotransferase (APT) family kinase protein